MKRTYKYRLYPSRTQRYELDRMLASFCALYNAALQQRIEAYRRRGRSLGYVDQANELRAVRAEDSDLAAFSYSAEQQVLRRLDKSFKAFFRRRRAGDKPGFPRFKSTSRFDAAEFRVGDGLTLKRSRRLGIVGVPGEIKVKWHRELPQGAKVKSAIVARSLDRWYVCLQIELAEAVPVLRPFAPVGVDLGLYSLVALSTGKTEPAPRNTARTAKRLRRAQRAVARKRRGSHRQRKAKARVARLHAEVAARRRDFSHKLSRSLADRFTHLAFEDLNIEGLARGMLAKSIHDAAWRMLVQHTTYKAENAGGVVVLVDSRGTSKTCPDCGTVAPKRLAERMHRCGCGCTLDRDVAAARVVLGRANFGPGAGLRAPSQRVAA